MSCRAAAGAQQASRVHFICWHTNHKQAEAMATGAINFCQQWTSKDSILNTIVWCPLVFLSKLSLPVKNCANSNLDELSDALWFTRITKAAQKHKNAVRAGQLAVLIASKSTVLHLQVAQVNNR